MQAQMKDIDVFILCGGLGERLRSISGQLPKPMVKIGRQPFLNIPMTYMAGFGFRRFILGLGYKANIIRNYYERHRMSGLNLRFCEEKTPLDTGGAVKNVKGLIQSNPFFVLNGDSFCRFNPSAFLKFHQQKKALISILLKRASSGREYGEVKIDKTGRITGFYEKKSRIERGLINAGIYIFDKKVFNLMPQALRFSLERDFFPGVLKKRLFGYPYAGFFIDIGTAPGYLRAKRYFATKAQRH